MVNSITRFRSIDHWHRIHRAQIGTSRVWQILHQASARFCGEHFFCYGASLNSSRACTTGASRRVPTPRVPDAPPRQSSHHPQGHLSQSDQGRLLNRQRALISSDGAGPQHSVTVARFNGGLDSRIRSILTTPILVPRQRVRRKLMRYRQHQTKRCKRQRREETSKCVMDAYIWMKYI